MVGSEKENGSGRSRPAMLPGWIEASAGAPCRLIKKTEPSLPERELK